MMRVQLLESAEHLGLTKGEIYRARPYGFGPSEKVELLERESDGWSPNCTEYRYNVKILPESKENWSRVEIVEYLDKRIAFLKSEQEEIRKTPGWQIILDCMIADQWRQNKIEELYRLREQFQQGYFESEMEEDNG